MSEPRCECGRLKSLHIPDAGKLACPTQSMDEKIPIRYFSPEPEVPVTGPFPRTRQVPEQIITDECKYCGEGEPEWSPYAKCWIHRRPTLDKRCTRKILGPCGELPDKVGAESGAQPELITHGQAAESALRFINAFFDNPGRTKPQIRIPRDPTDDDAILMAYIKQQETSEVAKHAPQQPELELECRRLREALELAIKTASGRWCEWGSRAESVRDILEAALLSEEKK